MGHQRLLIFVTKAFLLSWWVNGIESSMLNEQKAFQFTSLPYTQPMVHLDNQYPNSTMYSAWPQPLGNELHPFFQSLYNVADAAHRDGHRQKRFLRLIPRGSRLLTKYNINIPVKNATMYKSSYNFDLYIYFPFFEFFMVRKKRSVSEDDPEEIARRRRKRETEKLEIFAQVEKVLEGLGLPPRDCILRLLCDLSEAPFLNGLFGDLVNSVFRPSLHPNDLRESASTDHIGADYLPYLEAEKHGRIRGDCQTKYSDCPSSLASLLPAIEDKLF